MKAHRGRSPWSKDFQAFYLDDGVLAGDASAVSKFLSHLGQRVCSTVLAIAMDNTEVTTTCLHSQSFSPSDFPGNFKTSQVRCWDSTWCESFLSKASALLVAIGQYRDSHGAFTFL